METINDWMFNLAKVSGKLGDLILEESHYINRKIQDNITKLKIYSVDYYVYIPDSVILIPALLTFSLAVLFGFIILHWNRNRKLISSGKANTNTKAGTLIPQNKPGSPNKKPVVITIKKGLYIESICEVNTASKNFVKLFQKERTYSVLIRAQMRNYMNMVGTKFELHGNHIHNDTKNTKEPFRTKDAYYIMSFKIINDIKDDSLVGNVIARFMNDFNYGEYTTNDFIICAIGSRTTDEPLEFNNGIKYIGYELENYIEINKQIPGFNIKCNYTLLLPIHQIYDIFMDIYNDCIFESTKYVIDNDNYESWNGKSINTLGF